MRKANLHIAVVICVFMTTLTGPVGAATHYVSPGQSIQAAIDDANDDDEIEVAPGTYNEAINFGGKAVRLYSIGGPEVTIIDANGIAGAYHVVQCISGEDANTMLEGFTITGGHANGPGSDQYGGGMYCESSSPTVTDCNFINNSAGNGGGMYNHSDSNAIVTNCSFIWNTSTAGNGGAMHNAYSNPTVTNCTFSGNSSAYYGGGMCNAYDSNPRVTNCEFLRNEADWDGGGMYNHEGSSPTVTDCNFTNNISEQEGGGMTNSFSSPMVTNCTFSGNMANLSGGGMLIYKSSPNITNCTFSDNTATRFYGGGMLSDNSSPTLTDCTLIGNSAGYYGGGMCNAYDSNPRVTNCEFLRNEAGWDGGGMFNIVSSPMVTNCTFNDNTALKLGGGMYNGQNSSPTVTNCTFIGNSASDGGGVYNKDGSPTVTNCTLWNDTPEEIVDDATSSSTVTYSDVQGGWPGLGNIDANPCFVDANNPDPNLWNLRLKPDSPCIDAGNTTAVPAGILADLDENPRGLDDPVKPDTGISFLGVTVDMGAYEFQLCRIPGDINCDGDVDFDDFAIFANNWLAGVE
jgi:parallel beta-helix repeat protein